MPLRHYIFNDEDGYLHRAQMINNYGVPKDCVFGKYVNGKLKCIDADSLVGGLRLRNGYPFLLAGVFKIFGQNSELLAFSFNIFLGLLSIILAFFIGRKLWSDFAGLLSALFVSILPINIWWSVATSLEIPSLFFILLGSDIFLLFKDNKKYELYIISFLIMTYASYIRSELILILPFIISPLVTNKAILSLIWKDWYNTSLTLIASFFSFTSIVTIITNRFFYPPWDEEFFRDEQMFSLNYFIDHINSMVRYHLTSNDYLYFVILIGAVIGIWQIWGKSKSLAVIFAGKELRLFWP